MKINREQFLAAYVECALWSSVDDNGSPLDDLYGSDDIAPETLESMRADCNDFITVNRLALSSYAVWVNENAPQWTPSAQAGHDFWLTRNGHGAGFWGRGLPGTLGERLTDAARVYGSTDLYVGDDGRIYA